jgi:cell division protein FtsW
MNEAVVHLNPPVHSRRAPALWPNLDHVLLGAIVALALLGVVMVGSASISIAERNLGVPLYYLQRQAAYLVFGTLIAALMLQVRLDTWQRSSPLLLLFAYFLLVLVLVPGVGREVNGAVRWIPLGVFNLQVSEPAKLLVMLYMAGYLVRRAQSVRSSMPGFLIPVGFLMVAAVLLLLEPDFGAAVVLVATGMGMLFLAGVPVWRFLVLGGLFSGAAAMLIVGSPYRWQRLTAFLNPWEDPFNSGFQLTQSLIAIGRGEWFGVGLGASVQKLFYLPEAHTDFLFAVLAEELGLFGVVVVIGLYSFIVWRAFWVGARCLQIGRPFAGYLAYGIAIWLALQAFINMGVNMGLLPTKGLTLPLLSFGGSSLVSSMAAFALLLRADHEMRVAAVAARSTERAS